MANQSRMLEDAVQKLANTVNSAEPHIKIADFTAACRLLLPTKLGFGQNFSIGDSHVMSQVTALGNEMNRNDTIEMAMQNETTSENVRLLKEAMEMVRNFVDLYLENNIRSDGALHDAITEVFGRLLIGPHDLPTLDDFLNNLGENGNSIKGPFRRFKEAAGVVIDYIDRL